MAGTITHRWDGTILTVTSDSGSSSADLKGAQGDMGPRGPQGAAGVVVGGDIDLTGYATEAYVDQAISGVEGGDVDLSNYYTKRETDAAIQNAVANINPGTGGGGGGTADLSNYYTKGEVDNLIDSVEVDMSSYYTKTQVDNLIPDTSGLATKTEVATATSDKATKTYVDNKVAGLATEAFVTNKIAEAQLGGEGGDIDLTGYATKDDIADMATETYVDDAFKFDWLGSLAGKTISEFRAMLDAWLAANVDKTAKCQFSASNNFIDLWNAEDTTSTIQEGSRWTCEITSGYLNNSYTVITLSNYYYNKIYTINKNVTWKPIQEIATINVVSSMIADAIAALDGDEVTY